MNTENNEEKVIEEVIRPGDMLRQAREKLGYSQKDIANRLRLRVSVIDDIENNRFEQEQLATFTRGYVRSYAKFVGLDEEELVRLLDKEGHAQPQDQEMQSFSRRTKREAHDSRIMRLTWLLAVVFIGITGTWWWQSQQLENPSDITNLTQPPIDESLATGASLADPILTVEAPVTETQAPEAEAVARVEPVQEPVTTEFADSFNTPAETETAAIVEDDAEEEVLEEIVLEEPEPAFALELSFAGDCWIDVRDASGKRLDTGIKKAGDKLELNGAEPFKVVLGAPSVVTMKYKGEAVDLSKYPAGKVARMKLPQ